jgi:hypothetical protein
MIKYYKDLEVSFVNGIEYKANNFAFQKDGLIHKFSITDTIPNSFNRNLVIWYQKEVINPIDGTILSISKGKVTKGSDYYDLWYNTTSVLSLGELIFRASMNVATEKELGKNGIFYNPLQDYVLFQPLFYDVDVVDNTITVIDLQYGEGKTIKYSIDGINYQDSNSFNALVDGTHTIYVKTVEDDYPSIQTATISTEEV